MRRWTLAILLIAHAAMAQEIRVRSLLMFNQHLYLGTFVRPSALAFDRAHDELWMADGGSGVVGVYRPDGAELYGFRATHWLHEPARIAVSPDGKRVAVVDGDHAHVRLFNYRGDYKGDAPLPKLETRPVVGAIAYDAEGKLYVGENRTGQIFVYEGDTLKLQFGSHGTDEGQFQSICAIAIDAAGTIYVIDQRALAVQIFDNQGNFVRGWGRHEMGREHFSLPSGIALDSKGRLLITDELRHQVKIFTADGKFVDQFGGLGTDAGQLSFPTDIVVDAKDRIYVAERETARVQVFELVEH